MMLLKFIPGLMNRFIRFSNDFPPVFFALDYIYMYRTINYDYNVIHRINASKQTRHTLIRNIDLYLASGLKWCFVKSYEYRCCKRSQSVRKKEKRKEKTTTSFTIKNEQPLCAMVNLRQKRWEPIISILMKNVHSIRTACSRMTGKDNFRLPRRTRKC